MNDKKIEFKVEKEKIGGFFYIPTGKPPFPGVIFFHGSGGTGATHFETAKMLSENGILGFAFNYRGAGLSGGVFEDQTVRNGITDSKAALEFFVGDSLLDKNKLGFLGGSFGGHMAAFLSEKNPKSIVLQAPTTYPDDALNYQRDEYQNWGNGFEDSQSYKNISKYKGSLLIEKCEEDEVIPEGMVELYFDNAVNTKRKEFYIIKGAKHRLSVQPKQKRDAQNYAIQWFKETL